MSHDDYHPGEHAIDNYRLEVWDALVATHGRETADAVDELLEHIDLYELIDYDEIRADVYTLPGVSKLIESMTDYEDAA